MKSDNDNWSGRSISSALAAEDKLNRIKRVAPYFTIAIGLIMLAIAIKGCAPAKQQWEHIKHDAERIFTP